jgi:hypothetical protein
MTGHFKPLKAILPSAQQLLWPQLCASVSLGFVLYGGTAIALRFGHRLSVDFDFFTERTLDREALQAAFPFLSQAVVLQDERNTLTVLVQADQSVDSFVKLSFFGRIDFGRVGEPDLTDDGTLFVASVDDLMATKVRVVLQRAESKDYRDIAEMIRSGVSLSKGLASAQLFFGPSFQPSESLKALVYFEDGDLKTLPESDRRTLVTAVSAVRKLPEVTRQAASLT